MTFTDVISQPPYPGANPREIAEIIVGRKPFGVFSDWESVWVQHRWREGWPIFRFVAAERPEPVELWSMLQIIPGDSVVIKLGGEVAVTGVVTVRQTAYDANSHTVSIQGVGKQWIVWRGAILDKSQNFPGNYVQVAEKVMEPFKVKPKVIGEIDGTKFDPEAHNNVGDTVWSFLETLGKMRDVILGADYAGNLLLIGQHESTVVDSLIEGVNIISCQCVINIHDIYEPYGARGQSMRSDAGSPGDAALQDKYYHSTVFKEYSPLLVPTEHPVWTQSEVDLRAFTEFTWGDGTLVEATVVVYGWFTSGGRLWAQCCGERVMLMSPMTTFHNQVLSIRTVTCTQDSQSGTRTTLDLVATWYLNDKGVVVQSTGTPTAERPASGIPAGPGSARGGGGPNETPTTGPPAGSDPTAGQGGTTNTADIMPPPEND